MNSYLIEVIGRTFPLFNGIKTTVELKQNGEIIRLSFNPKADTISDDSAVYGETIDEVSFFIVYFEEERYKVKQQMIVEHGDKIGVAKRINTLEIEICHLLN